MTFEDAMRAVEEDLSFPQPEHLHARRLAWLLDRSGLSARAARLPWALVAGSCGKASTARFLAFIARRLLDRAGVEAPVLLGTKPPLAETPDGNRERYQLFAPKAPSPTWIAPEDFARHVTALAPFASALVREAPALGPLAPYDLRFAVLLRHALEQRAAFAVIEANIGLREDPTAAFPEPAVQLLTPIDTDHAHLLRPPDPLPASLAGLGERAGPVWHKAGGLRAEVPVVVGFQISAVTHAVAALAAERRAGPVVWRGKGYDVMHRTSGIDGSDATLRLDGERMDVRVNAVGRFQVDNAAQAAAAAWTLVQRGVLPGDRAAWREATRAGLAEATMPGRMEVIAAHPTTLLQVGASAVKMQGFVDALSEIVPSGGRVVVCASFLARIHSAREPIGILARAPWLGSLVTTACETEGDAADLDPDAVRAVAVAARPGLDVRAVSAPHDAVAFAKALAIEKGCALAIVGNGLWRFGHAVAR